MLLGIDVLITGDTLKFDYNYFSVSVDTTQFVGLAQSEENNLEIGLHGRRLIVSTRDNTFIEMEIYNVFGQKVISQSINGSFDENLNLPNGVYIVVAKNEFAIRKKKIMIVSE